MFAWVKPPMLPTTPPTIDAYFDRTAPDARARVLAAYPGLPAPPRAVAFGSDAMFCAPAWAFADAYSAHAPTYVYRFDHADVDACGRWGSAPPTAARSCTSSTATRRIWAARSTRWAVGCSPRWAGGCSARG